MFHYITQKVCINSQMGDIYHLKSHTVVLDYKI